MLFTLVIKHSQRNRPTFSVYVHAPLWRNGGWYVSKIALSFRGMLLFPTLITQHRGWTTPPRKITQNSTDIFVTYYVFGANVHDCLIQPCIKALIQHILTMQWLQITYIFFWATHTTNTGLIQWTQKVFGHLSHTYKRMNFTALEKQTTWPQAHFQAQWKACSKISVWTLKPVQFIHS